MIKIYSEFKELHEKIKDSEMFVDVSDIKDKDETLIFNATFFFNKFQNFEFIHNKIKPSEVEINDGNHSMFVKYKKFDIFLENLIELFTISVVYYKYLAVFGKIKNVHEGLEIQFHKDSHETILSILINFEIGIDNWKMILDYENANVNYIAVTLLQIDKPMTTFINNINTVRVSHLCDYVKIPFSDIIFKEVKSIKTIAHIINRNRGIIAGINLGIV